MNPDERRKLRFAAQRAKINGLIRENFKKRVTNSNGWRYFTLKTGHGGEFGQAHKTRQVNDNVEKAKKVKKWRIIETAVTPTHGGFRRSYLDTVAGSARCIFFCAQQLFRDGQKHANCTSM